VRACACTGLGSLRYYLKHAPEKALPARLEAIAKEYCLKEAVLNTQLQEL
jgi:hypothetical protein